MFLQISAMSQALGHAVQVNVIVPQVAEGATYKTLWLLHGLSDDHSAWMRYSSIEGYAAQHGIAVVMPNADRSWYTRSAVHGISPISPTSCPPCCAAALRG